MGAMRPSRPAITARRRVTLDFSGPPLSLPRDAEPDERGVPFLELDTTELLSPPSERPSSQPTAPPPLGLEYDLLGGETSTGSEGEDGWNRSRRTRVSTIPPPILAPSTTPGRLSLRPTPLPIPVGDALELVGRSGRPPEPTDDLAAEMTDRFALGDFSGALRAAELLLGQIANHSLARQVAESSREQLERLFLGRLGSVSAIPKVAVPESEVRWLGLDHRAGFLLSRVDGHTSVEDVLDMSGMPRMEALKILVELLDSGVIRL